MFSFFSRRPKSEPEKASDPRSGASTGATRRGQAADAAAERQRAAARRTAEQIDRIESEMIQTARPDPDRARTVGVAAADAAIAVATRRAPAAVPPARSPAPRVARPAQAPEFMAERKPGPALAPLAFRTVTAPTVEPADEGILIAESTLPPDLEEAAILFANGQSEAAASTLEAAIVRDGLPDRGRQGWLMLLDVLQACDRRADFDARAIAYAARFETSPPSWREPEPTAPAEARGLSMMVVAFGEALDADAARPLEQARKGARQQRPLVLEFSSLRRAQPEVAGEVARLLDFFIQSRRPVTVRGARALHDAARGALAPGRRDPAPGAWQLALTALRLLGDQQAFEDLSIDFCVTYEVSPPSWEPLPPHVSVATTPGAGARMDEPADSLGLAADTQSDPSAGPGRSAEPAAAPAAHALVLRGELSGRMAAELGRLRTLAAARRDVVIDARALVRLDFVAAGEMLNEVVALRAAGKTVTIEEPSHVIEALLTVMGVREHARLRRRR